MASAAPRQPTPPSRRIVRVVSSPSAARRTGLLSADRPPGAARSRARPPPPEPALRRRYRSDSETERQPREQAPTSHHRHAHAAPLCRLALPSVPTDGALGPGPPSQCPGRAPARQQCLRRACQSDPPRAGRPREETPASEAPRLAGLHRPPPAAAAKSATSCCCCGGGGPAAPRTSAGGTPPISDAWRTVCHTPRRRGSRRACKPQAGRAAGTGRIPATRRSGPCNGDPGWHAGTGAADIQGSPKASSEPPSAAHAPCAQPPPRSPGPGGDGHLAGAAGDGMSRSLTSGLLLAKGRLLYNGPAPRRAAPALRAVRLWACWRHGSGEALATGRAARPLLLAAPALRSVGLLGGLVFESREPELGL